MNEEAGKANKIKDPLAPAFVSVVVPVFNGGEDLDRCLGAIFRSDWPAFECIVVDDASSDKLTAEIASRHGAHLESLDQRSGPGVARNTGVKKARGEIIFFTDADVLLHQDAIGKAVSALESDPDLAAVFGSYDDTPAHRSFLSRYRNLYHHWTHQSSNEEATTFWSGCGAIRRQVFLEMGGFNAKYTRPSIEDIELGYRLRQSGYRIRLLKTMFGTHLKQWKFRDMLRTDIFQRGVPWIVLMLRYRLAPADLNLSLRARAATVSAALLMGIMLLLPLTGHVLATVPALVLFLSCVICSRLTRGSDPEQAGDGWKFPVALLIGIFIPLLALAWVKDPWALLPLILVAVIIGPQSGFNQLLAKHGGIAFAIAVVPLQVLFFMSCALSVFLGFFAWLRQN